MTEKLDRVESLMFLPAICIVVCENLNYAMICIKVYVVLTESNIVQYPVM